MSKVAAVVPPIPDVLKALSDDMRWSIVAQMSAVDELACTTLERTLPVSKPTISYHIKVLYHAGLVELRKEGRHYFYRLRRDVLDMVLGSVASELGATPVVTSPRAGRPAARGVATGEVAARTPATRAPTARTATPRTSTARTSTARTPTARTPTARTPAAVHASSRSRAAGTAGSSRSGAAPAARAGGGSRAARSA